ncbi:MAG: N-acetylmuramoyl-L-alanine amidase, partial [Acidimicrobiia bacterium]
MDPLGRRRILQAGLAFAFLPGLLGRRAAVRAAVGAAAPPIRPRADWGADLPPKGPMEAEQAGDVRFLLVHHSVSVNDYAADAVPEELRSFYRLHTAPEKGWPDIAYNFLIDRFGVIWEGRAGSIEAPVKGDSTGGSQGFAVLCCFIGDHRTAAPSPEAQASMVALLAWLADRHVIDPRPGTTTSFVSRGSNRWPAGATVTTTTIAGHRDMSKTVCPGDAAYRLVRDDFPARVAAVLGLAAAAPPPPVPATVAAAPVSESSST